MKRYEVLNAKKLFHGSDIIRAFGYKAAITGTTMPFFRETDCFVCCSPYDVIDRNLAVL